MLRTETAKFLTLFVKNEVIISRKMASQRQRILNQSLKLGTLHRDLSPFPIRSVMIPEPFLRMLGIPHFGLQSRRTSDSHCFAVPSRMLHSLALVTEREFSGRLVIYSRSQVYLATLGYNAALGAPTSLGDEK